MSKALEYHRATDYPPGAWEDEAAEAQRYVGPKPSVFKDYADAERLPLSASVAGPLLADGAGVVRSKPGRDYGGGTMHWRAYSSAGGLFPVEAYVAAPHGLYSFDPLTPGLVPLRVGDARADVAAAADADADTFVVLTGIHRRTGWKYLERGYRHIWWDAGTMLANLLALAAADGLRPRLHTAFADLELDEALGLDADGGEVSLAVLALTTPSTEPEPDTVREAFAPAPEERRPFELADRLHAASRLDDVDAVRHWRVSVDGDEPLLDRVELARAIRGRRSVRDYSEQPLPKRATAELLAWAEAPIPADAPRVVQQRLTVAAIEGLVPGVYDASLELIQAHDVDELRERASFVAMEQEHPGRASMNVFQMTDVEAVVRDLGDRGYRWAQLEAGIRAGRVQIGAFMRGWGAAASTFYDDEVSRLLETDDAPMLMVAVGPR